MRCRSWARRLVSVALTVALTGATSSCTSASAPPPPPPPRPEPACAGDKATFSLGADSYADVGRLGATEGSGRPFVTVFDENHPSRIGQVEIAIMLNRLYHSADLRHLALEGSVLEGPAPDFSWFTSLPDPEVRRDVALQMLKEGEVSAAEFAAMILPGFQLHPIEHEDEYAVDLSDKADNSYLTYLVVIALATMTDKEAAHADALLKQHKDEQAIRFVVGTDEWTKERYQLLEQTTPLLTIDKMRNLGSELEAKADEVGADVSKYDEDLQAANTFYDMAAKRSTTMATNTVDLAKKLADDCAPIAMDIGAAHTTEVTNVLQQKKMSYAVVSPRSLSSATDNSGLSTKAYDRKLRAQSIDPPRTIGALLDGRRKPPMASQQKWFKPKAELYYASTVIAREAFEAGSEGVSPYGLDQEQLGLGGSASIDIDLSTFTPVPYVVDGQERVDVIFKVTDLNQNIDFWVRAGKVALTRDLRPGESLEQALKRVHNELKKERPTKERADPTGPPPVVHLTPDVNAAIARTREGLESVELHV